MCILNSSSFNLSKFEATNEISLTSNILSIYSMVLRRSKNEYSGTEFKNFLKPFSI